MNSLNAKLQQLIGTPSDINEHLATLKEYSSKCNHVTEFGVRGVVSLWALLAGKPETLIGVDINACPVGQLQQAAKHVGTDFTFIHDDTLKIDIEPTELLFIDTCHVYEQLAQELKLHANKVSKYIILHDTTSFGTIGQNPGHVGLWPAVEEFLQTEPWTIEKRYTNNNGLTIFKRLND